MMPIVFWASLAPWPRLKAAAETSWPRRKPLLRVSRRLTRWNVHEMRTVSSRPTASPMSGDSTMNRPILRMPSVTSTSQPALATAAPAMPPTRAWDELVGRPR